MFKNSSPEEKRRRNKIRKANELTPDKFLSEIQGSNLMKNLSAMESVSPRDTLMLELLAYTGARPSEILGIRAKDIDPDGLLFVTGLKGSNSRRIPLHPRLAERLKAYAFSLKANEQVFPLTYSRLDQISKDYLPSGKSLRSLRHTYALKLYKKTKDIRLVQKMLGHRFVSTTEIYTDYAFSDEELKERATVSWE